MSPSSAGLRAGHTLVELLVSLAILSLVTATLVGAVVTSLAEYGDQRALVRSQEATRYAQEVMARAFRTAGADPTGLAATENAEPPGVYPDEDANGSFDGVRLVADFNPADEIVDDDLEDMAFTVSADTLFVRWIADGDDLALAYPVKSLRFNYYDEDHDPITSVASIEAGDAWRVQITLKTLSGRSLTTVDSVQTWVYLRNN